MSVRAPRLYKAAQKSPYALCGRHAPCAAVPPFLPVARSGKPCYRRKIPARTTGRSRHEWQRCRDCPGGKRRNRRTIVPHGVPLLLFCRLLLLVEQVLDTLQGNAQLGGRRERFRYLVARYDHEDIFIAARIPQQDRQAIAVMQDGAASAEHLLGVRVFIIAGGAGVPLPPAARGSTGRRKLLPALPSSLPNPGVSGPAGPIAST